MTVTLAALILLAIGAGGAAVLRRAWSGRAGQAAAWRWAGWLMIAGGATGAAIELGSALGFAVAIVCEPIGALLVVAGGATRRAARTARGTFAPEPLVGPSRIWRGWLKALLAGPIGMIAALGLSFCYATWAPGAVQTRLLVAALLVPALWGLAMTWTLADARIIRSTAVLTVAIMLSFGLAFVRGIA